MPPPDRYSGRRSPRPSPSAPLGSRPAPPSRAPRRGPAGAGPDSPALVDIAPWARAAGTFETRAELTGYCDRWAQGVPQLAATWGAPDLPAPAAARFGHTLGVALCELDML